MTTSRKANRSDRGKLLSQVKEWHDARRMPRGQRPSSGNEPPKSIFHAFGLGVADDYGPAKGARQKS